MPAKNVVKTYIENGYYHTYNRGVEKRNIFLDEQDCSVFLHYLKLYLSPIEVLRKLIEERKLPIRMQRFISQNLSEEIDLLSFALMPNHFHLFLKQNKKESIIKFMQRLLTSYTMYFNKKYTRIGSLFQGVYKAALIEREDYFLHLTRYIHLNPMKLSSPSFFIEFSSYPFYLGTKNATWIKPQEVLSYFKASNDALSYKNFVENSSENSETILGRLVLEESEEL